MKLARVAFAVPHPDPQNPSGVHRTEFTAAAGYQLDRTDGVVTVRAPNGNVVQSTYACWWLPAEEPTKRKKAQGTLVVPDGEA